MVLKLKVSPDSIGGDVETGYGKVADAFRATFRDGAEVGAAVAVYRDGVKVVDLWGGYRNGLTKDPWRADTMVKMFSTTKGVAALVVAAAVSRGVLSYDAKVADYWPEFAQAGKGEVTVRELLAHQAGVCALKPKPTLADALTAPATPSHGVRDKVMHIDVAYSLGFCKPFPQFVFGSSDKAFGTPGFGGSFGCADPETGIGFAYVMNRLGFHLWSDPRELALRQALFREVLRVRPQS
jgi:CubicO group peptidase (beta-lactamase class C family)